MSGPDDPDFLSRWSRRKRSAAEDQAGDERDEASADAESEREADRFDGMSDAEILAELRLPEPETLGKGDDFTAFLASGVPLPLRNRALRRLWRTNPALANLDSLVEYGEDYTNGATVIDNLKTAYEVGKGIRKKIAELAGDDAPAESAEHAEVPGGAEDGPEDGREAETEGEIPLAEAENAAPPASAGTESPAVKAPAERAAAAEAHPPGRRRMRFTYS